MQSSKVKDFYYLQTKRHKRHFILSQIKPFHRQRVPEPSCARKETVDVSILITSRTGDRKIMQTRSGSGINSTS